MVILYLQGRKDNSIRLPLVPLPVLSSKAQIPLDLSCRTTCRTTCRRPGRRQVGDQVSDFFSAQNLSETRFPTFFCSKLVGNLVSDFFSAQNLSETRFPTFLFVENLPLDLSRHVEIDLSCRRPGFRLFFCSKLVGNLVLSRF